jgi:hypothetical protein
VSDPTIKSILDVKIGNIISEYSKDKIVIFGLYNSSNDAYPKQLELLLSPEDDKIEPMATIVPYTGSNIQLFIADFTGDNKSEIMVRGILEGTRNYEMGLIYKYIDNKLIEIFDQEKFCDRNVCIASYFDNYKVYINYDTNKYSIDLASKPQVYLDQIYSPSGIVNIINTPTVDNPSSIYPIKQVDNSYYNLMIQQKVIGLSESDILGVIQTLVKLKVPKCENIYKGLLVFPNSNSNKRHPKQYRDNFIKNKPNMT